MKILVISSYLPYPLFSGGQVRLYNLIKELSKRHEITLICEKRTHQTESDIQEVQKICKKVITVDRKNQWRISNIIKAGISANSFLVTGHTLSEITQIIKEVQKKETFDLIHVETYYVMQNVPPTKVPIVLVDHNIEYQIYQKYMKRAALTIRPLLTIDIAKMKNEEEHFWRRAKAVVAVSREDQEVMKMAGAEPYFVPNGVNTDQFVLKNVQQSIAAEEKRVLFLGDFSWIQNRDAATFIIKEIWPRIRKKLRTENSRLIVKAWIVGRTIPDSVRSLTNAPDIVFDEESSGLATEKIFQKASVLLAPIRIGGGTSYKILESMASGTPVITMQMSATALGAKDWQNILVGQTAEELSEKTVHVLENNELYKKISKNGREFVQKYYTWKEIAKELEEVYNKAVLY